MFVPCQRGRLNSADTLLYTVEERMSDLSGELPKSRPPAAIIVTLKCPGAQREAIIRPHLSILMGALEDLGIHLQVEDIFEGLLFFWQELGDFDRSMTILREFGDFLRASATWGKGSTLWRITVLKPPMTTERQHVLVAWRDLILTLFGPESTPEVAGAALSFRAPATIKMLDALWRYYRGPGKPAK